MKVSARSADLFVRSPTSSIILVYGPDGGLVGERSKSLRQSVLGVEGIADPFRFSDLDAQMVLRDTSVLFDEVASLSLTGGRRVVRVANVRDGHAQAFAMVLDQQVQSEDDLPTLVIAEAGELGPRSTIRRLFESHKNGAALPCYAEDSGQVVAFAEELLLALGHRVDEKALQRIARSLEGNRAVQRQEIEKLSLYVGEGADISVEDVECCLSDSVQTVLEDAALAATAGERDEVDRILGRCFLAGESPVSILRALSRVLTRLHIAAAGVAEGTSVVTAIRSLKPPVFWKSVPRYKEALRIWSPEGVLMALRLVAKAELECKGTVSPARLIAWRTALQIAAKARRGL